MNLATTIEALVGAGATPEMILAVVKANEAEREAAAKVKREKATERKRRERSRDVTVGHAMSRGQGVTARDTLETKGSSPRPPLLKTQSQDPPSPPTGAHGSTATIVRLAKPNGFSRFWEAYPRKTAKGKAQPAFCRALKRIDDPDALGLLLAGIERAKRGRQWAEGYVPHPATWLNGDCWLDEPEEDVPRQRPMTILDRIAEDDAEARRRALAPMDANHG